MFHSAFACFSGCPGEYPVEQVLYACPRCGGLLEVRHDLTALAGRSPEVWRQTFDERFRIAPFPLSSGVWSKQEWVCPELRTASIVSLGEGATPLVAATRLAAELDLSQLWIKQCGSSHSGSFKDLGMTVLVSVVNQIRAGGGDMLAVACASTGDTSASLAAYAAAAGLPAVVLLPKGKVSAAQLVQPRAHGALTIALDTDFDGCMRLITELTADGRVYLANSRNPLRVEGQKTLAIEVVQQLGWTVPDWVVIPGGNLGNVSALGKGFGELLEVGLIDRLPRLACAQAAAANPLVRATREGRGEVTAMIAGVTLATAIRIGAPVSAPKALAALARCRGVAEDATEKELLEVARLADHRGLYTCPQTAVALAVLRRLRRRGEVHRDQCVVVVSTAHGLKFGEFKEAVATAPTLSPAAVELAADAARVRQAIEDWSRAPRRA